MTTNILDALVGRISDEQLRKDISRQIDLLRDTKDFGLVFERHLPETVRLPRSPVRRGTRVAERNQTRDTETWLVQKDQGNVANLVSSDGARLEREVGDLVVIRDIGEPIHPGLYERARIEPAADRPFHPVIGGENYHVLQALQYVYAGQVDCIYIDPPYNTGARDWKYNNNYVDENDRFRHSKWLSFIEKRLRVAKPLLRSDHSVLIVTIDDKEYLHLGMLLNQMFPDATIQMVSSVINPKGVARPGLLSRTNEYIFYVLIGEATIAKEPVEGSRGEPVPWQGLRRSDIASRRGTKKGGTRQFYPLYVEKATGRIIEVGEPLPPGADRESAPSVDGCIAVFPVRDDGTEMNWGLAPDSLKERLERGFVRSGKFRSNKPQQYVIKYLTSGRIDDIDAGRAGVKGTDKRGGAIVTYEASESQRKAATTQWDRTSHNAQLHGTELVERLIPGRRFPFPKSLYAVEDTLRLVTGDNRDSVILDFFAGSGSTLHAVMRLNAEDEGRRQCIMITNNEVGAAEAEQMRSAGLAPGDEEWEERGVFRQVTIPRTLAAVSGQTPEGEPVEGSYKFGSEFPIADGLDENVIFFDLEYLDSNAVSRGRAFSHVAPLLWLKAGSTGDILTEEASGYSVPDGSRYGILFDIALWRDFCVEVSARDDVQHAYVVTNSLAQYQQVVSELPADVQTSMLYEDYLRNFEYSVRRSL